jgi:hypothetical protein
MCKFVANKYSTAVLMGANEKARVVKNAGRENRRGEGTG